MTDISETSLISRHYLNQYIVYNFLLTLSNFSPTRKQVAVNRCNIILMKIDNISEIQKFITAIKIGFILPFKVLIT